MKKSFVFIEKQINIQIGTKNLLLSLSFVIFYLPLSMTFLWPNEQTIFRAYICVELMSYTSVSSFYVN